MGLQKHCQAKRDIGTLTMKPENNTNDTGMRYHRIFFTGLLLFLLLLLLLSPKSLTSTSRYDSIARKFAPSKTKKVKRIT